MFFNPGVRIYAHFEVNILEFSFRRQVICQAMLKL